MKEKHEASGYDLDEYPEIDDDAVNFPEKIPIAYAVCGKECGAKGFIVDGQTQVCQYCGKLMFRTAVKEYTLKK